MNNRLLLFLLILTAGAPSERSAAQSTPPPPIRVVMDNNYPPYAFTDAAGQLQGILPDQWRLWEQKTGIPVVISALDWEAALNRMKAGEFDVIDTIFKTPERVLWLDFTKPYARLKVPIFFDRTLSGIHDAASLTGFAVATKRGDEAANILLRNGVKQLLLFTNYEDVIRAAQQGKVNVFVVDQTPALYFLNKYDMINRYKQSAPIHVGEFHRAVLKGNPDLLRLVETGFDRISPKEIRLINRKWEGSSRWRNPRLVPYLFGFVALLLLLMLLLLIWTRTLRRVLTHKTTELKSANERLRLANKQFRALFDNAAVGILVADPETQRFDFANPFIERILGYNPGELIGKSVADIHPAESLPQIQAGFEAQVRGDKTLIAKAPCQRKDGRIIYVDINAAPVSLNGKNHIMGLFSDITQRKLAEDALHAKNEEMDRFVYTASHDLKAPLITFQTYLGFLTQDMQTANEAAIQQDIAFMHSAADRMKTLLDDLLTLSRVGRVVQPPESIAFSDLVTDALRALAGPIATRRVEIVRSAPELILSGDRVRLVEIWQNLIDNAVKFMGDQPHPRIEIGWDATPAEVCFFVRDNGIGLDSAHHTQMFDLFEKLDPSSEGTGLGLALIKRIIELYHGRIWIESPGLGQGCCVRFSLPEAIPHDPTAQQPLDL